MGGDFFAEVGVDFKDWLARDRDPRTVRDYLLYYNKLKVGECGCGFRCIQEKAAAATTNWGRKLVRLYARFCWELGHLTYDQLMRIRATAKLRRAPYKPIPPTEVEKEPDIPEVIKPIILVMYYGGIRLADAVHIAGESYKIYEIGDELGFIVPWYIRGRKKLYTVFSPVAVLQDVMRIEKPNYMSLKNTLSKRGISAKAYRKHFYQKCTLVAPEIVCDFYQSRIRIVGARHYEALLEKAIMYYSEVMKALDETTYVVLRARSIIRALGLDRFND